MAAGDERQSPPQPPASPSPALAAGALGALAVWMVAQGIAAVWLQPDPAASLGPRIEGATAVLAVGAVALLGYASLVPPAAPARAAPGALTGAARYYLVGLLGWIPIAFVIYPTLLTALGVPMAPQPVLEYFAAAPGADVRWWLVAAVAVVLGPIAEEVMFRGYLQQTLRSWLPAWLAIALTSALFGLVHGLVYALPVGLLGVVFGVVKERFTGLAAPILAHALHNGLTIAIIAVLPSMLEVYSQ